MAIQFEFEPEGTLLFSRAWGFDDDIEDVKRYNAAVIEACAINSTEFLLLDETELDYRIGTIDIHETASACAQYAPLIKKVALVFNPKYIDDATFWEDVVVNRGMKARIFTDSEKALAWIREH
jgi:hypothetical protein